MRPLWSGLRELWGLFIEDASLTIGILACVALAAWAMPRLGPRPTLRGPLLVAALGAVLIENVLRAARRARGRR